MIFPSPRAIAILDAPSNLGLCPPGRGVVPGVYKLPWALRDCGIVQALRAFDAGSVVPPRYEARIPDIAADENDGVDFFGHRAGVFDRLAASPNARHLDQTPIYQWALAHRDLLIE